MLGFGGCTESTSTKREGKKRIRSPDFPDPRHATGKSRSRKKQEPKRAKIPFKNLALPVQ